MLKHEDKNIDSEAPDRLVAMLCSSWFYGHHFAAELFGRELHSELRFRSQLRDQRWFSYTVARFPHEE